MLYGASPREYRKSISEGKRKNGLFRFEAERRQAFRSCARLNALTRLRRNKPTPQVQIACVRQRVRGQALKAQPAGEYCEENEIPFVWFGVHHDPFSLLFRR